MTALSEDGYLMLRTVSAAAEPIGMFEAAEAIQGEPASLDGRTREHKAFVARRFELVEAFVELWKAGLICEVSEDGTGSRSVVTDAGRAALATYQNEERGR